MNLAIGAAIGRVGWIAADTWRALVRQRLVGAITALALLMIVGGRGLLALDFGAAPQRFVIDFGFAAIAVFGAMLAIVATVQMVLGEAESGTAALLLAKPVRRGEYVLGKWVGVMMLLGLFCAVTGGLVALLAGQAGTGGEAGAFAAGEAQAPIEAWRGVVIAAILQWMKLGVLAAGALVLASYLRSPVLAIVVGLVIVAVGYLRGAAQAVYSSASAGPVGRGLDRVLAIIPDLRLFEVADRITLGPDGALHAAELLLVGGYAALYAAAFGAVAAWLLQHRDF